MLDALCRRYWYPLYAFIRRRGHDPASAEDLVEDFFAALLEKDGLSSDPGAKGRFRSFLMAACCHFLANRRDHDRALSAVAAGCSCRSSFRKLKTAIGAS